MEKSAYISPQQGVLELNVIRDANPRVTLSLDLGIPNFTVFSMTLPLVENQPRSMSELMAEAIHVLCDEVANFMLAMDYAQEVIVQTYGTVLNCYKGMSKETDTDKTQGSLTEDDFVKTFTGTFNLPQSFVNETQNRVVTAAARISQYLQGLAAEARKAGSFENFRQDFHHDIKYGTYWHLTSDPNFKIDPSKGPRDMADGRMETGKLMISSHLENWDATYNYDEEGKRKETRPYAALIDMSEVPRTAYHQVSRGFGNEFWVDDPSKAKVVKVMSIAQAKALDRRRHAALPQSEEELEEFYNQATGKQAVVAGKVIKRPPKVRRIELSVEKPAKPTVSDVARVIRQYRGRSLKTQPKPLFVVVYDQMGKPSGTLPLSPAFKNKLLSLGKKGSVEFTNAVTLENEHEMRYLAVDGIPSTITIDARVYKPSAFAGQDTALYNGDAGDWLVKLMDGRIVGPFPGRPNIASLRYLNYPIPKNRYRWRLLNEEDIPQPEPEEEESPEEQTEDAVLDSGAQQDSNAGRIRL